MDTGTPLRFIFRGSAAHVFHRETGRNLEYPAPEPAPEEAPPAPAEPEPELAPPAEEPAEVSVPAPAGAEPPPDLGDPFAEDS